jgi:hypothetical protein
MSDGEHQDTNDRGVDPRERLELEKTRLQICREVAKITALLVGIVVTLQSAAFP